MISINFDDTFAPFEVAENITYMTFYTYIKF